LLSFFDLGGDVNHLLNDCFYWRGTDDADRAGWAPALNVLFDFCPRRFHLLNDFVSMSIACLDLEDNGGLFWYRRMLLHSFEHPDLGISFNNAFNDWMESLYAMAIEHQVEFGSRKHFKVWARSLKCKAERGQGGLGKLGTRLLLEVSPLWRLKVTIDEILDRCIEEFEDEDKDFFMIELRDITRRIRRMTRR
jgi:hypothetical protein